VGISLKTHAVKYLLCANQPSARAQFALPVSAVVSIDESVALSRMRPVLPKNCACLFIGLPVYAYDGAYLGKITELEIKNFIATIFYTDTGFDFPVSVIAACSDAVLLKKEQVYPLGQRIPAPFLSKISSKADGVITKPILRLAIQQSSLVKLTLSLPPFSQSL
jgi:hypothetical protein